MNKRYTEEQIIKEVKERELTRQLQGQYVNGATV